MDDKQPHQPQQPGAQQSGSAYGPQQGRPGAPYGSSSSHGSLPSYGSTPYEGTRPLPVQRHGDGGQQQYGPSGAFQGTTPAGPPQWPYSPTTHQPDQPKPRRRGLALVATTALLVGAAGGVGGAAAYSAIKDDPSNAGSVTAPLSQSGAAPTSAAPDGSVQKAAATMLPSVVKIGVMTQQGAASGSGIVISSDGLIVTNNHVVEAAAQGGELTVTLNDGKTVRASIVGRDQLTDLAVIRAEAKGLTPAKLGNSGQLAVGQQVVAIGSPFGLDATVTSGIVSALNRPVNVGQVSQGNSTIYPAIQTDAAINPGNSGGPLVNLAGEVVGIDAAIQSAPNGTTGGEPGSIGLGFAIPIDEVLPIVQQMIKGETPTHARLGIGVENAASGAGAQITDGAKISEVNNGSAADSAGLQSGDVITKIDDHLITSSDGLVAIIRSYRPGDQVTVTYERGGDTHTVRVTLDSDATTQNS
jgi:putative serine protease PepD